MLSQTVHDQPLVYLDNAATTHKPLLVIEALRRFYAEEYATVHRGAYLLSEKATDAYEAVRKKVARFINAASEKEIIYTRGASEAINLVAAVCARAKFKRGDEILISAMEHHSNIVPWQMVCETTGTRLRVVPMNDRGELLMDEFDKMLGDKTRMVSVVHVSNALGTINPVREICAKARKAGALSLVDGAQSTPHMSIDVRDMGCDFYAFSGHKVYGPTGIGILYGRYDLLCELPPYQGGGDMITSVTFAKTEYALPPQRFEAGTPAIAEVIALGAALDYVQKIGLAKIAEHEASLLRLGTSLLESIPSLKIIGRAAHKAGVISFTLGDIHPHDIATIVDGEGVALRAGHHCAQPVMDRFGVPATARASFALYNNEEDVHKLAAALKKVVQIFKVD